MSARSYAGPVLPGFTLTLGGDGPVFDPALNGQVADG
jgi:hypothetical protein